MSADTLTADGAAVALPPPASDANGSFSQYVYGVIPGLDEIVVGSNGYLPFGGLRSDLSGYGLDGSLIFQTALTSAPSSIFAVGTNTGLIGVATAETPYHAHEYQSADYVSVYDAAGNLMSQAALAGGGQSNTAVGFDTSYGFHVSWATGTFYGQAFYPMSQDFSVSGQGGPVGSDPFVFADAAIGGKDFSIRDNQVQLAGAAAITLPGEPAHAVNFVTAAALAGGTSAAVAWDDSGTIYAAVFDATTDSFGPVAGVTWGGGFANDSLHLVALPDGGFALSWDVFSGNPQFSYQGEVFTADGIGGGIISLAGEVAGIASHGDLYTVAIQSGQAVVQTYAINGSGGSTGGGSAVSTSAADYTAPDGVASITLTGSNQTVHANNAGDAIFSNDTGNVLYGGTGNDTFHMGRGGDWAQGGGGSDTFAFAAIPWAAGGITDFGAGDVLDLSGLLSTTQDIPAGGFSDGYLQLTDDGAGDTQVWARYATSGADSNWWLVTTLDGISPSSLDAHHTVVTLAPNAGGVTTSASDYVAPSYVTSITLTGSQQYIDASATNGVTIGSNDTGNVLIGGAGPDYFHLGRGGDWVAGGAGSDTFAYGAIPWAGGGITDFNAAEGDRIDVKGLLANAGFTGADPFADGYLKYGTDGGGNAQLWADYNQPGNSGWWLVATLDGVPTSSLHYSGGLIT